ncbi:MAG: L-2-amino-thiazoline-4-carboxylic acid hydrolase [Clostridiales bacterium]|jgi:hypothetical protein|nr:L-2-amino-thiazoline-4-carboxylic acid hydrolase [Clostridiales bacterium]
MAEKTETVSLEDAKEQVRKVCIRLGLLHLAFARTLVDEFGEEKGKELILKAIKDYGTRVAERGKAAVTAAGGDPAKDPFPGDLPAYGMTDSAAGEILEPGENEIRRFKGPGCVMSEVWREYGESELGRLYCFVDPVKSLAYNPATVHYHAQAGESPGGGWICEHVIKYTTQRERDDFANSDKSSAWINVEPWIGEVKIPAEKGKLQKITAKSPE